MSKRLFRVKVEFEYYALAEDELEARWFFSEASTDVDSLSATGFIDEADPNTLGSEWRDCIPFGEDDDRTCAEILGCDAASLAERAAAEAAQNAREAHPKLPLVEVAA